MNQFFYYSLQFFLGGASVVAITLIAKYLDPKYVGVVYALPVILITSIIFIYLEQGTDISRKTLKSTFAYEFTLIYFIVAFYYFLGRMNFWPATVLSVVSWAIIAYLLQLLFKF